MTTVIVMPGTGSDADFATRVFGPATAAAGAELVALEPTADLVDSYLTRIDALAARGGRFILGGVSIGAAIAVRWALDTDVADRCDGVLAALAPWSGPSTDSIAAASARLTADGIDRDGLDVMIGAMVASSPRWLGIELARSWRALQPRGLVDQLRTAATFTAPTLDELSRLAVPLGVAVAPDDPLHPATVGRAWAAAAPHSAVAECPLSEFGPNERLLGDACWTALTRATASTARLDRP